MSGLPTIQPLTGQRHDRESDAAVIACNDYLRAGSGRSLSRLIQVYTESDQIPAPTTHLGVLKRWSTTYAWQDRASAYDAEQDRAKTIEIQRLRTEGLAADYNRIVELDSLYQKLREVLDDRGVWHTDIKMSATGATVDVEVFNKPLIDSLRGVLDDLAKETGGRKIKQELTGKDDSPLIPPTLTEAEKQQAMLAYAAQQAAIEQFRGQSDE